MNRLWMDGLARERTDNCCPAFVPRHTVTDDCWRWETNGGRGLGPMSHTKDYALGFDLGGTNIKALAVTRSGRVVQEVSLPTNDRGDESWRENVRLAFQQISSLAGGRPARIGVAAPGLARPDQRAILDMPGRLKGIVGLVWADYLGVDYAVPVLNDAQAALLGE
jgi:predicted NBD/HSP70 family sugar kinase